MCRGKLNRSIILRKTGDSSFPVHTDDLNLS